jgi:hypothetical protein
VTDDPSQVDSETLLASLIRDIDQGAEKAREAYRWFEQARVTAYELKRRKYKIGKRI